MTDWSKPLAVLVVGPESTGTRLLTRILIRAGCHGSDEHWQPWDESLPDPAQVSPVVWRRSVPHGGQWPVIRDMRQKLESLGYRVHTLVTCRLWRPTVQGQFAERHVADADQSQLQLGRAYPFIFGPYGVYPPYEIVPYEAIVLHGPWALAYFLQEHGLQVPQEMEDEIYDGNAQWLD